MKILVLSDSHSALSYMRCCVDSVKPDAIVHLGDYYDDGVALGEEYPEIPLHQVPGNCDRYRYSSLEPEVIVRKIFGVNFYMSHGHRHNVKMYTGLLLKDARSAGASVALYGHTHEAECYQEPDGLWVLNPGSCGYYGGSAGIIEIENNKIICCRIIRQSDLELMK